MYTMKAQTDIEIYTRGPGLMVAAAGAFNLQITPCGLQSLQSLQSLSLPSDSQTTFILNIFHLSEVTGKHSSHHTDCD